MLGRALLSELCFQISSWAKQRLSLRAATQKCGPYRRSPFLGCAWVWGLWCPVKRAWCVPPVERREMTARCVDDHRAECPLCLCSVWMCMFSCLIIIFLFTNTISEFHLLLSFSSWGVAVKHAGQGD